MNKPSSQDTEQLYLQHKGEAEAAARWASRWFWKPVEETQDHADFALALLLLERMEEYDPEQMELGPWLKIKIIYHLRNIYTRGRHPHVNNLREPFYGDRVKPNSPLLSDWERGTPTAPTAPEARPSRFQMMLQEVGEEGAALLGIIRDLPGDLWEEVCPMNGRTQNTKYNNLRAWLIDTQDWTVRQAEQAFMEVEECL